MYGEGWNFIKYQWIDQISLVSHEWEKVPTMVCTQLMAIEKNCKSNDNRAYKKNDLNFMYIYRNLTNILRVLKKNNK